MCVIAWAFKRTGVYRVSIFFFLVLETMGFGRACLNPEKSDASEKTKFMGHSGILTLHLLAGLVV